MIQGVLFLCRTQKWQVLAVKRLALAVKSALDSKMNHSRRFSMTTASLNTKQTSLLKKALLANAAFSSISGLSFILFTQAISQFLGWSNSWILATIGAGLVAFALMIYTVAQAKSINHAQVMSIIAADLSWVLLSIVVIFTPFVALTLEGKWAVAIVADIVAIFAFAQYWGLRRLKA